MEYKIYNYTENMIPGHMEATPADINYNILGLHKKRSFIKGELQSTSYYGEYDLSTKTYSDLILTEDRVYHRDGDGFAYKRNLTVSWYTIGDSIGETKSYDKFYSIDESVKEGEIRRANIVSRLKLEAFGLLGQANAYDFLTKVFTELGLYRDGFKGALIDKITNLPDLYLDGPLSGTDPVVPIRLYLIGELTF